MNPLFEGPRGDLWRELERARNPRSRAKVITSVLPFAQAAEAWGEFVLGGVRRARELGQLRSEKLPLHPVPARVTPGQEPQFHESRGTKVPPDTPKCRARNASTRPRQNTFTGRAASIVCGQPSSR